MSDEKKSQTRIDFSKLKRPNGKATPLDPEVLFGGLPTLPDTPNDLWRGQTDALKEWHLHRDKQDILISLNTGAGKTLVGLLIAQSLVNEQVENVVYACSTIDLVRQTQREAKKIGISCSVRHGGRFNNDQFEIGKSFCVTTYSAIFNSFSTFRRKYYPGALIFDDAHVAEKLLRDSFTLTIDRSDEPNLYVEIAKLFVSAFREINRFETYKDVVDGNAVSVLMVPPTDVQQNSEQLIELLRKYDLANHNSLKFSFHQIKDHLSSCAVLISGTQIEICPPFLPVFSLPYFSDPAVRRIYLSATLNYKTDIARAFGRIPKKIIEPKNDAGNGERLILFSDFFSRREVSKPLMHDLVANHKVVISVPSYAAAGVWSDFGRPPARESFSEELDRFREARTGAFILVSRVDGIDLPHDACRVMVIDSLPTGFSLLERYQWEMLNMHNLFAAKIANRLTQLFGRINRGRNDYGAFIANGPNVNRWLRRERNLALLPELLRKQVLLGSSIHEQIGIKDSEEVKSIIDSVIGREESWVTYYSDSVSGMEVEDDVHEDAKSIEEVLNKAAIAEVQFASAVWENDYNAAREILEQQIETVAQADSKLAGWHNIWLGAVLNAEGDIDSANTEYSRARKRLGMNTFLPRPEVFNVRRSDVEEKPEFVRRAMEALSIESHRKFSDEVESIENAIQVLADTTATPRQAEECVRLLGDCCGLLSTRPDNDEGVGPDVLWQDEKLKRLIAFELKTGKSNPATYRKEEIGQGHDHLQWVSERFEDYSCCGLIFVGPDGNCSGTANPSDEMFHCPTPQMFDFGKQYVATMRDFRKATPIERLSKVQNFFDSEDWTIDGIFSKLAASKMKDVKNRGVGSG